MAQKNNNEHGESTDGDVGDVKETKDVSKKDAKMQDDDQEVSISGGKPDSDDEMISISGAAQSNKTKPAKRVPASFSQPRVIPKAKAKGVKDLPPPQPKVPKASQASKRDSAQEGEALIGGAFSSPEDI